MVKQIVGLLSIGGVLILAAGGALAALPDQGKEALYLHMVAAVDRDCDGSLADESETDRSFATQKSLRPGECVIYQTEYRNDGDFSIRHMRVTNKIPQMMVFIDGSAEHVETPPGLFPDLTVTPDRGAVPQVIWRFGGALGPGEAGYLRFRVRLQP